jgi:deoxycitidine kinase/deoxyguanosine kinase
MQTLLHSLLDQPQRRHIISIEGNIGAGKSTLLSELQEEFAGNPEIVFMPEPVDVWSNVKNETGETILSCFYRDPAKYSFGFQVMAYVSRLNAFRTLVEKNPLCRVIVCERSLEADNAIFANMLMADGQIEPMLYQVYKMLYDSTVSQYSVDTVVYLDASPETCLRRIAKRSRDGESGIELPYLCKCRDYYDAWVHGLEGESRVLYIDANVEK